MTDTPLRDTLARIARGDITATEAFDACAAAIEAREPEIRAFAHLDLDHARDALPGRAGLPLAGLPVALKDIFDSADMPTTYGSPIYAGWRPKTDAAVAARLRALGASLVGKTVTTEFAMAHPGPTRNPRDPARTPGGSSSGSAAAVAAGMTPAGIGTQTAGSVIRPASFCGIVGFKPSFGLLPTAGMKPLAPSFDTVGLFGRAVDDCALLCDLLLGGDGAPLQPVANRLRVGLVRGANWGEASPEAQAAVLGAAETLAKAGHAVEEITPPASFDELDAAHWTIMAREAALATAFEQSTAPERISASFSRLIAEGLAVSAAVHAAALAQMNGARAEMDALGGTFDLLLTFSAPGPAPIGLDFTGSPVFNKLWSALGTPCVTIPVRTEAPAPIGVQLVGRRYDDASFLARALAVEQTLAA
ncbi:amidase [Methylopila henanensis]|uniref:Amidase n=1 Tax=Methylopila henanensis TaxID=873516 RepID=A0ABW4K506_9HYPH